jgi:hypothetical protein
MIRREAGHTIGTITLGERCFAVRICPTELAALAQYLTTHNRLILTAPGQDPLVVLRLGDLLRDRSLRGGQQEGPKTLPQVSVPVDAPKPGTGLAAPPAARQGQPPAAKRRH